MTFNETLANIQGILDRCITMQCVTTDNKPISQIPQCIRQMSTMHHFVTEMCTHVHISVTKWCIGDMWLVHCGIYATGLLSQPNPPHLQIFTIYTHSLPVKARQDVSFVISKSGLFVILPNGTIVYH